MNHGIRSAIRTRRRHLVVLAVWMAFEALVPQSLIAGLGQADGADGYVRREGEHAPWLRTQRLHQPMLVVVPMAPMDSVMDPPGMDDEPGRRVVCLLCGYGASS